MALNRVFHRAVYSSLISTSTLHVSYGNYHVYSFSTERKLPRKPIQLKKPLDSHATESQISSELVHDSGGILTNTTAAWLAHIDPKTGMTYWWNPLTNQTTHAGAPDPNIFGFPVHPQLIPMSTSPPVNLFSVRGVGLMAAQMGGVMIGFTIIGVLFRMVGF